MLPRCGGLRFTAPENGRRHLPWSRSTTLSDTMPAPLVFAMWQDSYSGPS